MKNKFLFIFPIVLLVYSCENGFDKSLISKTEKLISPNGGYALYRYHIESPMAFGSGFTVINILKSDEKCDVTDRNILRFGNNSPFWIKWKNDKTLIVKCLIDGGKLAAHQPIKTEVVKWKDWTFNVEYYSMYSSGLESDFIFDSYSISGNKIKFKSNLNSLVFNRDEVQFSLENKQLHAMKVTMSSFNNKLGLSFAHYNLTAKGSYNKKPFQDEQSFIMTKI